MTEPSDANIRSIHRRLTQRSQDRKEDFQITLVRYGVERFLYRLSLTPQVDNYVIKGSTLFTVWLDQAYRPTRDLDLAGTKDARPGETGWLKEVMLQEFPEDGLIFDTESLRVKPIRHMHQHVGVSASFIARLGKTRIHLTVDIGFSDVISPPPKMSDFPTLLDLPRPRVKLYPKEAFVAEKFEAIVRWGRKNSRLKDFADIVFVSENDGFDGRTLAQSIRSTFEHRGTRLDLDEQPAALSTAFYSDPDRLRQWQGFSSEIPLVDELGSFTEIGALFVQFLRPPWVALASNKPWSAQWPPGGPWKTY